MKAKPNILIRVLFVLILVVGFVTVTRKILRRDDTPAPQTSGLSKEMEAMLKAAEAKDPSLIKDLKKNSAAPNSKSQKSTPVAIEQIAPVSLPRFSRNLFPSRKGRALSVRLAVNLIKVKEYRAARKILEDIRLEEPTNSDVLNNLGFLCGEESDLPKAEEYLRQAVQAAPKCSECNNNLGTVLVKQGKLEEAKGHFQKAAEQDPKYQDAHLNLALVMEQLNDWRGAFEWYKKGEALITDPELKKMIGLRTQWMSEILQGATTSPAAVPPRGVASH